MSIKAALIGSIAAAGLTTGAPSTDIGAELTTIRLSDFDSEQPPRRLSNEPTHKDFRPDFMRVGLRIDGVERSNVSWYDADRNMYSTVGDKNRLVGAVSIEPFWRYPETRQSRRELARWRAKRSR